MKGFLHDWVSVVEDIKSQLLYGQYFGLHQNHLGQNQTACACVLQFSSMFETFSSSHPLKGFLAIGSNSFWEEGRLIIKRDPERMHGAQAHQRKLHLLRTVLPSIASIE